MLSMLHSPPPPLIIGINLAELLAKEDGEDFSDVMTSLRTMLYSQVFFCLQPSLEVSASEVCTVSLCHESIEETSVISFCRRQLSNYMYIGVIYMFMIYII